MIAKVKVYVLILMPGYDNTTNNIDNIIHEQFESLQKEVTLLRSELNDWQNTTINILKKYLLENDGIQMLYSSKVECAFIT